MGGTVNGPEHWFRLTSATAAIATLFILTGQHIIGLLTVLFVIQLAFIGIIERDVVDMAKRHRVDFTVTVSKDVEYDTYADFHTPNIPELDSVCQDCRKLLRQVDGIHPSISDSTEHVMYAGGKTASVTGEMNVSAVINQDAITQLDDVVDTLTEHVGADDRVGEVDEVNVRVRNQPNTDLRRVAEDELRTEEYVLAGKDLNTRDEGGDEDEETLTDTELLRER